MSLFLSEDQEKKGRLAVVKSFKRRKDCIMKKTMELSVLCDVKACAIIFGPDGTVETWPDNREQVQKVIQIYRNLSDRKRKRPQCTDNNHSTKKQGVFKNQGITNQDLLKKIDAKLTQVRNRIEFLKSNNLASTDAITEGEEMPVFQEITSCDHTAQNPLWFDTQLDKIPGFEQTEEFQFSLESLFDMGSKQLEISPCFNNLVLAKEQESTQFQVYTNPYSFRSGSESLEALCLHNDQEAFQPFDAFSPNTLDSGRVSIDSSTLWWDDAGASLW